MYDIFLPDFVNKNWPLLYTSSSMKASDFKPGVAYKFLWDGAWTPKLALLRSTDGKIVLKLYDADDEEENTLSVWICNEDELDALKFKALVCCKYYGTWEKATHVCGKNCPAGR